MTGSLVLVDLSCMALLFLLLPFLEVSPYKDDEVEGLEYYNKPFTELNKCCDHSEYDYILPLISQHE